MVSIFAKVSAGYVCGRHHTVTGTPCQDRAAACVGQELAVAVLCDGAGSCAHSERAAQRLTEWLPQYLPAAFDTLHALPPQDAAAALTSAGQSALAQLGMPPEECYCTFLFYAAHRDGRWLCGHIGDGFIFRIRQDTAVVFSPPENGRFSNETYFLSQPGAAQHLRIRSGTLNEPYAVLLTSDGGGDTLFSRSLQQPAPAVEHLCGWLMEPDSTLTDEALQTIMRERMVPGSSDDVSIAILGIDEDE